VDIDVSTIASLVGAFGIGTAIPQWLAASKDRRAARAAALRAMSEVEHARWVDGPDKQPSFRETLRDFETAALIAQLPREPVQTYLVLAWAAFLTSASNYELVEMPEGGSIDAHLAKAVRDAAGLLSKVAWANPIRRRWLVSRYHRSLRARIDTLPSKVQPAIGIARNQFDVP
jgi:hypothetical protein